MDLRKMWIFEYSLHFIKFEAAASDTSPCGMAQNIIYSLKKRETAVGRAEITVFLLLGVLLSLLSWPSISRAEDSCLEGRVIVGFKTHRLTETAAALTTAREISGPIRARRRKAMELLVQSSGAGFVDRLDLGPNNVVVGGQSRASEVAKALGGASSELSYAECDQRVNLEAAQPVVPNDPGYSSLWGLQTEFLNCPAAWAVTKGSPSVVVAVIDTGVDYNHPDLSGVMYHNPDPNAPDVYGYDFVNNDNDPWDDHYHGTHVAGTIGAQGDNGIGVVGVNWNARIMALKVLSSSGSGYFSGIISSIYYAAQKKSQGVNVRVMNMSLGGGGYLQSFKDAIDSAGNAGIMLVAAAGNASNNNDSNPFYPASYTSPSIISVAATTQQNSLAYFSNYGLTSVDVGAPGYSIYSTLPNNSYGYLSGTSMAAPHVAGLAALILAVQPSYTIAQVKDVVLSSGTSVGYLNGLTVSGKLISAANAITAAGGGGKQITGTVRDTSGTPMSGVSVSGGSLGSQTTGSSGSFAFGPVEAGTAYTITPSSSCASFSPPSASGSMPVGGVDLNFVGTRYQYTLSGSITDPGRAGAAIAGAALSATWSGGSTSAVSDSNGAYSLTIPCGVSYTVSVAKSGFTFNSISGVMSGNRTYNFVPSSAIYTWSGVVIAESGAPLAGVAITAVNQTTSAVTTASSDANGNYSLSLASGQTYLISAAKTGFSFSPGQAVYSVVGDAALNFSAALLRFRISGLVTSASGPLSGATVSGGGLGTSVTDGSGRYEISGVPYGASYSISVSKQGYTFNPSSKSGTVLSDVSENFSGTINSHSVRVRVRNAAGLPISGVVVAAGARGILITNSLGTASLTITYGESYNMTLSHAGYNLTPSSFAGTVTEDVILDSQAVQKKFSIAGFVRVNNVGLGGAQVSLPGIGTQMTSGDGSFLFSDVPALTYYSASVYKAGFSFSPSVIRGTLTGNVNLSFSGVSSGLLIDGYVRLNGAPLQGVKVYGGSGLLGVRTTDQNGYYAFVGLPAGTSYSLSASKPGYTFSASETSGTLASPVRVDFEAAPEFYSIRGRVAVGRTPMAGVTVDAGPLGSVVTDSGGAYSFDNIPYGTTFRLQASLAGYAFAQRTGRVTSSVTANISGSQIFYRVYGTVASGGLAVSKAKISCAGYSALSGTAGAYSINRLPYGTTCTLSATKLGLQFPSYDIVVTDSVNVNF